MGIDNDEKDGKGEGSEGTIICIQRSPLKPVYCLALERIEFEDHGDYVVVDYDALMRLAYQAVLFAKEVRFHDDGKH